MQSFAVKAWLRVFKNSLILTNLKGNHCYSTFWHASYDKDMTRINEKYWQESSSSTCMRMTKRMMMMMPKVAGWQEHWMTSLTSMFPSLKQSTFHVALICVDSRETLGWVNLINSRTHVQVLSGRGTRIMSPKWIIKGSVHPDRNKNSLFCF